MNYYYDCEFLEGTQKEKFPISIFRKNTPPTIDIISIGIIGEDNREYYAISKDFNLKEVWNRYDQTDTFTNNKWHKVYWLRENVLKPIFNEWMIEHNGTIVRLGLPIPVESNEFTYKNFRKWLKLKGKTNKQIADEIKEFVGCPNYYPKNEFMRTKVDSTKPEFYGYYSAYDHVALCWLFGKMIDLPKGFPMYTRDLKQILDEKYMLQENKYPDKTRLEAWLQDVKRLPGYPKQENTHSAIHDARWNKRLHDFLKTL